MNLNIYASNTLAGSSNQHFFNSDCNTHKGRVFYKVYEKGEYNYSFLFTNIIASTYADGSISHRNKLCTEWMIEQVRVACCDTIDNNIPEEAFKHVTFDGKNSRLVGVEDIFLSDPVSISPTEYICFEIAYNGKMIPYHEEIIVSAFSENNGEWVYDSRTPIPSMVGCDRAFNKRVAFLGDSITQGCGTDRDSYEHWNAVFAKKLGPEYAYWNLGIGYGRANDAASDGIWLKKAKANDVVFVCFGVNDILFGAKADCLCADLKFITTSLKEAGITVILQTIPPFDYKGDQIDTWNTVNNYIKTELVNIVDALFDNVPVLSKCAEEPHMSMYGAHPNAEGCKLWGEAIYKMIKEKNIL